MDVFIQLQSLFHDAHLFQSIKVGCVRYIEYFCQVSLNKPRVGGLGNGVKESRKKSLIAFLS